MAELQNPFQILADMAQSSRDSAAGLPAQEEVQQFWSGIAFSLGGLRCIAPMEEVSEILTVPHFTGLPGVKPWVLGVANVRGRLVPIVELSAFLGLEQRTTIKNRRILVVEVGDMLNGIVVDSVEGLQNIPVENYFEETQTDLPDQIQRYINGYYQHNRLKLNLFGMHQLVTSEKFMAVAS